MIDPKCLQEIRAAVEAASPGPWTARGPNAAMGVPAHVVWKRSESDGRVHTDFVADVPATTRRKEVDDARFIALSRSAVPALLSELDRLRAEAAELWAGGHGGATCADDGERDGRCVCCGKMNPYRSAT